MLRDIPAPEQLTLSVTATVGPQWEEIKAVRDGSHSPPVPVTASSSQTGPRSLECMETVFHSGTQRGSTSMVIRVWTWKENIFHKVFRRRNYAPVGQISMKGTFLVSTVLSDN